MTQAERTAARLLRRASSTARTTLPRPPGPLLPLLRLASIRVDRVIAVLEGSPLRRDEARVRRLLKGEAQNAQLWYELGLTLAAQRRHEEAAEVLMTAAEYGPLPQLLQPLTLTFLMRPPIHELMGREENVARMRHLVDANPESTAVHMAIGAFLLDQGRLEAGSATLHRGYELAARGRGPAFGRALSIDSPALPPSFLVVGPQKTGTTSLYALLAEHPQVVRAPRKELQLWGRQHGRQAEIYDAYFPRLDPSSGFITGDGSPNYLPLPEAAAGTAERWPNARAIVLHREPVARAYSHYQMMQRLHLEDRSFEDAIEHERQLVGETPPLAMADVPDVHSRYLLGSCVLPYIRMWCEALGPEQVMVIESSYLSGQRAAAMGNLFSYLGLPPAVVADGPDRNVHEYSAIEPAAEARLREWFAPHEAALDAFLATHPARIPA